MKRIVIEFIPHSEQRYDTLGDWIVDADGNLTIRASEDAGEDQAFLVALHELVEFWLCRKEGVSQEAVDDWDRSFIAPADDPGAEPGDWGPYQVQHRRACLVEFLVASFLGNHAYGIMR